MLRHLSIAALNQATPYALLHTDQYVLRIACVLDGRSRPNVNKQSNDSQAIKSASSWLAGVSSWLAEVSSWLAGVSSRLLECLPRWLESLLNLLPEIAA